MSATVITITSGKGGVGKTTATANLSAALAGWSPSLRLLRTSMFFFSNFMGPGGLQSQDNVMSRKMHSSATVKWRNWVRKRPVRGSEEMFADWVNRL